MAGELELRVTDAETGEPISVRMHVFNARGRAQHPRGTVWWHDHFVFHHRIVLNLPTGEYQFVMERGPEYRVRTGYFILERGATDTKHLTMTRYVNMAESGWYCGDLQIHRNVNDIELLMQAEDLHIAPVITWWNDKNQWEGRALPEEQTVTFDDNRIYNVMAGKDERGGGALLYFNLPEPLPLADNEHEYPSPVEFLKRTRDVPLALVDIEKPFSWDMPIWVASGMCHSIGVLNDHQHRDGAIDEASGKQRDRLLYPPPHGVGRWSEDIYYRLLNCGIKIAPSAGSGSGVQPNPLGYNRVYVYCGDALDWESWWEGLRLGRVVVTNGPMMQPTVDGFYPGHQFTAAEGESIDLEIALNLATRDTIEYLQIIKNGEVDSEVRLAQWAANNGRLPPIHFEESGWFLVRAVTDVGDTYRLAMTGPYYVRIGEQPRISREASQFFLDWVVERAGALEIDDADQRASVLRYHRAARDFWQDRIDRANAD